MLYTYCLLNYISKSMGPKVPYNWKARGYWPKSLGCIWSVWIFVVFFPVVLGRVFFLFFLDSALLFWFLSKSNGFLTSNLKLFFWTGLYQCGARSICAETNLLSHIPWDQIWWISIFCWALQISRAGLHKYMSTKTSLKLL